MQLTIMLLFQSLFYRMRRKLCENSQKFLHVFRRLKLFRHRTLQRRSSELKPLHCSRTHFKTKYLTQNCLKNYIFCLY